MKFGSSELISCDYLYRLYVNECCCFRSRPKLVTRIRFFALILKHRMILTPLPALIMLRVCTILHHFCADLSCVQGVAKNNPTPCS